MLSRLQSQPCLLLQTQLHVTKARRTPSCWRSMPLRTFHSPNRAKTDPPPMIETMQTGFLYLDNIFPLRMNSFDFRQLLFAHSEHSLEKAVHRCLPLETLPYKFKPLDIIKRNKDGGAIVKFEYQSGEQEKETLAKTIVSKVNTYLKENRTIAPFNLCSVRSFLVKGHPFLEDMVRRYPTKRLRIEFQGDPVGVEKLYGNLRQYGKVYDITLYPNRVLGKDPSRYAIVQFTRIRSATSARNCLHGYEMDGTRLNILYERQLQTNAVKEWILNHPRTTLPVFTAILAGLSCMIFDPLREFFVTSKITQRFNPEEYSTYQWLRKETGAQIGMNMKVESNMWSDDIHLQKLKSWLREKPDTFIIINGPTGSGKTELVKAALEDRRNTLRIDCEELANARNELETTKSLAKQVGYFPIFSWTTYLSNLINSVVTATTGQAGGLETTPASLDSSILDIVGISLANIAPMEKSQRPTTTYRQRFQRWMIRYFGTTDEKERLHLEEEEEYDRAAIPVIFIDNFMKHASKNSAIWTSLAEWAALVAKHGLAHVVFVTCNISTSKVLIKALPGKSFSTINLLHTPSELSLQYVSRHIGKEKMTNEVYDIVQALGGRLNELEILVQKVSLGISPQAAFEDIIQRNAIEVRQYGFGEMVDDVTYDLDWSVVQFWNIVKKLSQTPNINYEELKWDELFDGQDKPIHALERAELVTILYYDGRPSTVQPGKPVYYSVFQRLLEDKVFAASMEVETYTYLRKVADGKLVALQDQIAELTTICNGWPPAEIKQRIKYLLNKVKILQHKVEEYDQCIQEFMNIVSSEWRGRHSE